MGKQKAEKQVTEGRMFRNAVKKKRDVRGEQESLPFLSCCGASVLHEGKKKCVTHRSKNSS